MSNKKNRKHTSEQRGEHKRISPVVLFIVVAVAAVVIGFIAIAAAVYTSDSGKSGNRQDIPEEEQQAEGLAFPYKLEDGKISIDSIIQFSGPNVDADNQESENIAGIEVENISEQYIEEAAVRLTMADDTEYRFLIQDLPVGGKTVAFELDSQEYDGATACKEAACEVQNQDITMAEDRVSVRTDGSKVIHHDGGRSGQRPDGRIKSHHYQYIRAADRQCGSDLPLYDRGFLYRRIIL